MIPANTGRHSFSAGEAAMMACLLEAAIPKAGNVHRGADFEDTTFYDFLVSAVGLGRVFDQANELPLGELVYRAVKTTQGLVGSNTNLGIILLFAPLAKVDARQMEQDVPAVLESLTTNDCQQVVDAIRLANPGGLGDVPSHDIREKGENVQTGLLELMELAMDRDTIARQYATGFQEFFQVVVPTIDDSFQGDNSLPEAVAHAHLQIMAVIPDTLISRKCGQEVARQCSQRAAEIVNELKPGTGEYQAAVADFDFWLRSDGHKRNPGTSADLVAAGLFAGLRSGKITTEQLHQSLARSRQIFELKS